MPAQSLTIQKHCKLKSKKDELLTWYTFDLVRGDGSECLLTSRKLFEHDIEHLLYDLSYSEEDEEAIDDLTDNNYLDNREAHEAYLEGNAAFSYWSAWAYCNLELSYLHPRVTEAYQKAGSEWKTAAFQCKNVNFEIDAWIKLLKSDSNYFAFKAKVTVENNVVVCKTVT